MRANFWPSSTFINNRDRRCQRRHRRRNRQRACPEEYQACHQFHRRNEHRKPRSTTLQYAAPNAASYSCDPLPRHRPWRLLAQ